MTLRTLIVDDERLARSEMRRLLAAHEDLEIVGEATNADEAEAAVNDLQPDLLFLDVQMPGGSGFDLLERLDAVPFVVFSTAYDAYALEAFEVSALDYLVKPIEPERLAEAVQRVREQAKATQPQGAVAEAEPVPTLSTDDQVFVKDGKRYYFVQLADVRYFASEGNYTRIVSSKGKPLVHRSLRYLEERLDPNCFFRASRQHIINLHWVEDVVPWFGDKILAKLKDGSEIELSRRRSKQFREHLKL
ncbi:LytR/AlgR family response regulator transcription factor [Salisaeta longa]|uniref:LytR/AlgR family response regulator transcription factor n=1 Tax=Salisaeta longa TaxID=503170 RepID=UPI0003B3BD72|nr:LytTR family DNA-binding domain-containing protein [Salisaeta longa]